MPNETTEPKGFFITLESIDGLGKSTQAKLLEDWLNSWGHKVYATKEPGDALKGSCVGAGVRELLFKNPTTHNMAPGVGDLLFLADHMQNSYEIQQHLNNDEIVISDRYADSQFAYAAASSKQAPDWAQEMFKKHYGVKPDVILLLRARGPSRTAELIRPVLFHETREDISWALDRARNRRGHEEGKQEGKAWNDVQQQRTIQAAYVSNLQNNNYAYFVDMYSDTSISEVSSLIQTAVDRAYETKFKRRIIDGPKP